MENKETNWFYANESDEQILVDNEEALQELAKAGSVRPETLVWNETMDDWLPCRQVKPEWFSGDSGGAAALESENADATPSIVSAPASPHALQQTDPTPTLPVQAQPAGQDGMALASLICGIVGLFLIGCYGAGFPIAVAAVICGHLSRRRLVEAGDTTSAGMALAGLITGYIALGIVVLMVLGILVFIGLGAASSVNM